ncbi:hypothetical protein CPB83DRAFT_857069 [Crepidotus variabilis]|uniref:Uncharacterized protein n=1 Tax=Crepidotus variabilis TaxID=179855 RepID=A0A9P6ED45_9AGAR|nr:hypothetical protein CPB83DRAFT_857069 [Crepidotus variabilis]
MSFTMAHTILLPHPISKVFPALSESQHMERLQKLTPEAQTFTLLPFDHVQLPATGLASFSLPDHPKSAEGLPRPLTMEAIPANANVKNGHVVERVKFEFSGVATQLFGLVKSPISVSGAQIVDTRSRTVLYESVEGAGLKILKARTCEEVVMEDGKEGTKVKETVWGTCPVYLVWLVKMIAPGLHQKAMDSYHNLFE